MGILNVTPDSFSDGGRHEGVSAAVAHALRMAKEGATWIDVGGESTRPGSAPVPANEETRRVAPVVRELRAIPGIRISVDTSKASVARAALEAGADAINDVTALADPEMAAVVRDFGAGLVLMHSRGTPSTMDALADYPEGRVAETVREELRPRIEAALAAGIPRERLMADPGFGFAKTDAQNEELLRDLPQFAALGLPVLAGLSRKRFIGTRILRRTGIPAPPIGRDAESAAAAVEAARGGAVLLRVHNVAATLAALGERLDVVDAHGDPIGETVDRDSAHRLGISHRTSHTWLARERTPGRVEVLLQKRAADKDSFPGCYDISSAGHVPAGSDYLESAVRELREELGVTVAPEALRRLGVRHIHTESSFHGRPFVNDQFSAVFLLRLDRDEGEFHPQPSEVESVRWMDLDECLRSLDDPSFPNCLSEEELRWVREGMRGESKSLKVEESKSRRTQD